MIRKRPTVTLVPSAPTGPPPARTLGAPGQALWDSVTSEYTIDDAGGVETLMQICFARDSLEICMTQLQADGPMIYGKSGAKAHPLMRDELALRSFIVRGLARLGLAIETIKPVGRPSGWSPISQ